MLRLTFVAAAVFLASHALLQRSTANDKVDFGRDILPILADNCYECHGPDEQTRQAELRLDTRDGIFAKLEDEKTCVAPGDAPESELYFRISNEDVDQRMPPADSGKTLSAEQVALIRRWIEQGAPWNQHWSFVAPKQSPLPIDTRRRGVNPVDYFIRARLRAEGLRPSPPADNTTLIRRLTLDLTGLPPTPQQVDAFLADSSPNSYEKLVERLLASPRYGEHMAVEWLDAARYADTHGYLFDTARTMWRWRDWVIEAFNQNMPFDQFTVEQLAGDLLPQPTLSQKIATGFNRNHIINNEAGAIPQEYLVENILDRVNTTATVWMGLTLGCCQCHDHKYDPFTQREYYRLYAFLNNVPEVGLDGLNANAKPLMTAPTPIDRKELTELEQNLALAEKQMKAIAKKIAAGQAQWEKTFAKKKTAPNMGLAGYWSMNGVPSDALVSQPPTVFEAAPASYAAGILDEAASLDGLAYLNAGDRFNFSAHDAFSLAAWVRLSTKSGRLSIFSRMQDAKALFRGYTLQTFGGLPSFFLLHQFPDDMIQVQGKTSLEPEKWHHMAVTYDGSKKAAGVKLYLDGKLQKPGVKVDKLSGPITTDQPFWIGNGHPAAKLKGRIDEVRVYKRVLTAEEIGRLPGLSIESLLAVEAPKRTEEQARRVREFYLQNHAPPQWRKPYRALVDGKDKLHKRRRTVPTVMVMQERKISRETRILDRGAYNKPGERVAPGVPAVLPPLRKHWPPNRLGLARWLVDPEHPLTARVTVNRIWQMVFGRGLVKTTEDFGLRGDLPSHPQLLDWLATWFVENDWNVKSLVRLMVTSQTYRQSSHISPELLGRDPENRFLARGPRHRWSAEVIRDQALAVSGLLVERIGGPSVKPYQPPGLWREVAFDLSGAALTAQIYKQDSGENLYRRSMYTFWKRTAPPPTMLLFDAPDRERCVVHREQTNTPLQALALMNDPTFVEASRHLAQRIMRRPEPNPAGRIRDAFRCVVARAPSQRELEPLMQLFYRQRSRFIQKPALAEKLLGVGESKPGGDHSPAELAAYTIVASVLLNLDETITKR